MFPTYRKTLPILFISLSALALAGCGSSGGSDNPSPPPAPVAPPPPPPEPTFEERLADLAAFDPNPCRAQTPGFEALGGWLTNDGRELGASRVWISDRGPFNAAEFTTETHGARVWDVFTDCAVRFSEAQYYDYAADDDDTITPYHELLAEQDEDLINSRSRSPDYEDIPFPEPSGWIDGWNRRDQLGRWNDGTHDGQRVLTVQSAGNYNGVRTAVLQEPRFQLALQHTDSVLWILVGGYAGEERRPRPGERRIDGSRRERRRQLPLRRGRAAVPVRALGVPEAGRRRNPYRHVHCHSPGFLRPGHRLDRLAGHGHPGSPQSRLRLRREHAGARR